MIGFGFSLLLFTALISYNYISKTQNNTVLIETVFYIGIGAVIAGKFNKFNKLNEKTETTEPDFLNISRLLGYRIFPICFSISLACLDFIILFFFVKIIYKCSIIGLLNVVTLIYLLYMIRFNSLGDVFFTASIVYLYLHAFPFIIAETHPTEMNFFMKFGQENMILVNNNVFKALAFETIVFTSCLSLRYVITWIYLKIYRQRLLIYSMNYIQDPVLFSRFCDLYFNQYPLFKPLHYGLSMICLSFFASFAEYRIPRCLYSFSSITLIHLIYCFSIISLIFISISYNKKSVKKYNKYIKKFGDFVRNYNQNEDLKLEAVNRGSSLRQSRSFLCGLVAGFSLLLWSIKMSQAGNSKNYKDSVINTIFGINRFEMGYLGIYLYFGVLYTFYSVITYFAG